MPLSNYQITIHHANILLCSATRFSNAPDAIKNVMYFFVVFAYRDISFQQKTIHCKTLAQNKLDRPTVLDKSHLSWGTISYHVKRRYSDSLIYT